MSQVSDKPQAVLPEQVQIDEDCCELSDESESAHYESSVSSEAGELPALV